EAAASVPSTMQSHDVLILIIEPFPEPAIESPAPADAWWYRQFTIPLETGLGVRASGQSARNRYELPLLKRFVADKFRVCEVQFRYAAGEGCTDPPLSWHLTKTEKKCIADAWNNPKVRDARDQVAEWLSAGPLDHVSACQ